MNKTGQFPHSFYLSITRQWQNIPRQLISDVSRRIILYYDIYVYLNVLNKIFLLKICQMNSRHFSQYSD